MEDDACQVNPAEDRVNFTILLDGRDKDWTEMTEFLRLHLETAVQQNTATVPPA